jgi:hypothetical protein
MYRSSRGQIKVAVVAETAFTRPFTSSARTPRASGESQPRLTCRKSSSKAKSQRKTEWRNSLSGSYLREVYTPVRTGSSISEIVHKF